jgi:hypothetical protein
MALPIREILDTDDLYRRIAANHIRRDGTLSPTAFMKSSASKGRPAPDPEISVDLASLTTPELSLTRAGRPDEVDGKPHQGIVALGAAIPRGFGLTVRHDPLEASPLNKENPAHSLIEGNVGEGALGLCDRLAEIADRRMLICPIGAQCRVPRRPL